MKRTDPLSLRQIIDRVMDTSARRDDILAMRAASLWADVVGPGVNRMTSRRYVSKGVLHVYLTSGPLKSDLSFRRAEIARAINDILGLEIVKEIRLH